MKTALAKHFSQMNSGKHEQNRNRLCSYNFSI